MKQNYFQSGIIALTTVLIIGAIVLVISLGVSLRSASDITMSADQEWSHQARALATTCMERALIAIAENSAYAGNETVTVGDNSCIINPVTSPTGTSRTVQTSATLHGYTRRLQVTVSNTTPPITVSSWQEVTSF